MPVLKNVRKAKENKFKVGCRSNNSFLAGNVPIFLLLLFCFFFLFFVFCFLRGFSQKQWRESNGRNVSGAAERLRTLMGGNYKV